MLLYLLICGCCFTFEFACMLTTCFKFVLDDLDLWLFVSIRLVYVLDFVICFYLDLRGPLWLMFCLC